MGTLWPHSNSVVWDTNGRRAPGAKAYFYQPGTTTPRTTYQDAALTTPHTHPVLADGYGRLAAVFLDFGDYRERVRTAQNTTLWDTDHVPNPAPTDPGEGVPVDSLLTTGDTWWSPVNATRTGAVRCNGRSIGSGTSGASERANPDTATLYSFLWDNLSNSVCPVAGGRGANAAADFAANKPIGLPDLRGSVPGGLDTMGNSAASRFDASVPFAVGDASTPGSVTGQNHHVLTAAQMAAHTHTFSATTSSDGAHTHTGTTSSDGAHGHTITINDPGHNHTLNNASNVVRDVGGYGFEGASNRFTNATITANGATTGITASSNTTGAHTHTFTTSSNGAHTHTISGTTSSVGSDAAHNNTQRTVLGTWFIKL